MYKVASDRKQRVLHQGRVIDWVNGAEQVSDEDQYRQLQDNLRRLEQQILASSGDERKQLAQKKRELQGQVKPLRQRLHIEHQAREGYERCFIDAARDILSPVQFKIIKAAALREHENRLASLKEMQS